MKNYVTLVFYVKEKAIKKFHKYLKENYLLIKI